MGFAMKLSRRLGCNLIPVDGVDGPPRAVSVHQNQATEIEETSLAVVPRDNNQPEDAARSASVHQNPATEVEEMSLAVVPLEEMMRTLEEMMRIIVGLETSLGLLQTTVSDLQTTVINIDAKVNRLELEVLGTAGKEATREFTISLFVRDENIEPYADELIYGHGILLQCREQNEFAILTAGHVATKLFSYRHDFLKIGFFNGTTYNVDHRNDSKLFLAEEYIKHGTCDVGALVVRLVGGPQEDSFKNLVFSEALSFDTKFIGRSFDFCFQCYPFRVVVGLPTPSTEECSGTPMFSSQGELLSVLHGERRHHGRKLYPPTRTGNVHSNQTKEDSESVYVDMVKELHKLKRWDRENLAFIEEVEGLDEMFGCKNADMKLRKEHDDNDRFEKNPTLQGFFKKMKKELESGKAFLNPYFTIPDISDDWIRRVQPANVESLDQYLASSSESTYRACAPSEQL